MYLLHENVFIGDKWDVIIIDSICSYKVTPLKHLETLMQKMLFVILIYY